METIMKKTDECIKFEPVNHDDPNHKIWVSIINEDGCWSYSGRHGEDGEKGMQPLSHALGFMHEQNRPDRDDHVNIIFENIDPDNLRQFEKVPSESYSVHDTPYDYDSVMHYDGKAFSKNDGDTIVPKKEGVQLIDVQEMSQDDVKALIEAYKCGCKYDQ